MYRILKAFSNTLFKMANSTVIVLSSENYSATSVVCVIPVEVTSKLVKKKATLRLKTQGHTFIRDLKSDHAPQGLNVPSFMSPKGAKQMHHREFGMSVPSLAIAPGKSFKNPNFVNSINKYQNNSRPVDSSLHSNLKNSCHLIDSIKEKCPEAIPSLEEDNVKSNSVEQQSSNNMCLDNHSSTTHKQRKREHNIPKRKKQLGKKSRQNLKKREITEMMQEVSQDLSNDSLETNIDLKPHSLILKDFLIHKPQSKTHPPLKSTDHMEIPRVQGTDMLVPIISPPLPMRTRECSITDSEDSFVIFANDESDEELNNTENNESPCYRSRLPSLCESEDSFIMFERDDVDSMQDDESSEGCSEDSDLGSSSEDESEESGCDEVDSSFPMVDNKKVRFACEDKLCEVHPMIKWSYAYQAARKGPWEMYARDRCRFKDRAYRVERDIKNVFDPQHRERIYKERFENL